MLATDRFEELYDKLESLAEFIYNKGADYNPEVRHFIFDLQEDSRFKKNARKTNFGQKIRYCKYVRNLLKHNDRFKDEAFKMEPTDHMIRFLEDIINVLEKTKEISDIWIQRDQIRTADLNDKVLPLMADMRKNAFTHIPIVENGCVIGVFSENTVFERIAEESIVGIDEDSVMFEYRDYLPFEKHVTESFIFVSKLKTPFEIKQLFENARRNRKRIGMVFVTDDGKMTGKVLGIITAWDMLNLW